MSGLWVALCVLAMIFYGGVLWMVLGICKAASDADDKLGLE
jgi:hypothetical protein